MRRAIEEELADVDHSIDVIDPAFAPGTGRPEAGLLSAHGLAIFRRLSSIDFVSCDVVEVTRATTRRVTATLAARVACEMVSLMPLRRLECETEAR
jgi:arginase family enzyme